MNLSLVFVVLLAAYAASEFTGTTSGLVGNGNLLVGADTFTTSANLKGPVTISVETGLKGEIQICLSGGQPVVGEDLSLVCDPFTYGAVKNATGDADIEMKFTRKSFSAFSSTKKMNKRFAAAVADDDNEPVETTVTLNPSTTYYLSAIAPDSDTVDLITITLSGDECPKDDQFGAECVAEPENPFVDGTDEIVALVPSGGYVYVKPSVLPSWGGVSWNATQSDDGDEEGSISIYAGAGFLPVQDHFTPAYLEDDGNEQVLSLHNPFGPTWYVALYNSGSKDHNVTVTQIAYPCTFPEFGFNCTQNNENITSLSAANITATYEFDAPSDDDEDNIAYFVIIDTHVDEIPENATHFRVAVAPQGDGDAPALLARAGYPPSISVHDFNATGDYVNQLILPIIPKGNNEIGNEFNPYAYYVAVQGSTDYVIWVGGNCASNCSDYKHGSCECNGQECSNANLWKLPENVNDSFGRCDCDSSSYSNFDCTNSNGSGSSPFPTIYIVCIAVGGAIIIAVAIGVPVYCYLQNRKRNNYERV